MRLLLSTPGISITTVERIVCLVDVGARERNTGQGRRLLLLGHEFAASSISDGHPFG